MSDTHMPYEDANAALHALRDAGHDDICLLPVQDNTGDYVVVQTESAEILTQARINYMLT